MSCPCLCARRTVLLGRRPPPLLLLTADPTRETACSLSPWRPPSTPCVSLSRPPANPHLFGVASTPTPSPPLENASNPLGRDGAACLAPRPLLAPLAPLRGPAWGCWGATAVPVPTMAEPVARPRGGSAPTIHPHPLWAPGVCSRVLHLLHTGASPLHASLLGPRCCVVTQPTTSIGRSAPRNRNNPTPTNNLQHLTLLRRPFSPARLPCGGLLYGTILRHSLRDPSCGPPQERRRRGQWY